MTKFQVRFKVLTSIHIKYFKTPKDLNYMRNGFRKLSGPTFSSRTDLNDLAVPDPVLELT